MKVGDKHDEEEEKAPAVKAAVAIRDENVAVQYGYGARKMSKNPGRGKYTELAAHQSTSNLLHSRRSEMREMRW